MLEAWMKPVNRLYERQKQVEKLKRYVSSSFTTGTEAATESTTSLANFAIHQESDNSSYEVVEQREPFKFQLG